MRFYSILLVLSLSFFQMSYAQHQLNVVLQDQWTDNEIVPGLEDAIFNDLWGFTQNGINYVAMGSNIGTHFFQIDAESIKPIWFEAGRYQNQHVEHRDFKTYKNYLYGVCDEGTSSLQIFDLSFLPDSVSKVYDSAEHFQICHNIFIDTNSAKLYASGPNNIGLKVLSLEDPVSPGLLHHFTDVDYVHDCYVSNDTAFLNAGFDGLQIYYFGEDEPRQLGVLDFYPNQGYNHSGWRSPNGKKYAFIDETEGTKIRLAELGDLALFSIKETFGTKDYQTNIPHNIILTDYLAFVSYYNEGLRIFDITRYPVKQIGAYDTFEKTTKYRLNGAWGVFIFPETDQILISDRQSGLFLFHFPFKAFDHPNRKKILEDQPFLDKNSFLVPWKDVDEEGLFFTITTIHGKIIYDQQNYLNYINIPLEISPGVYIYNILDAHGQPLHSGRFIKAN
ncbi:LVIVD repeat-containing protein [Crocinitomix catalasitica]|uniref:LVIVD repeat-containing protein n=1 Tax=Crocinitomix catalasitica TaxID=184607 RepID=UPI000488EF43|nr:choice-of-anchor B family protein [Crocinitomix catalasitica]